MEKPSYVLFPKDVVVFQEFNTNYLRGEIIVHNTGTLPLMFKIKTNVKERFSVRPSFELIEPNTKRKIYILVSPEQVPGFLKDYQANPSDKTTVFIIQFYTLSQEKWEELKPLIDTSSQNKENSNLFITQLKSIWDDINNHPDRLLHNSKSRFGVQIALDSSSSTMEQYLSGNNNNTTINQAAHHTPSSVVSFANIPQDIHETDLRNNTIDGSGSGISTFPTSKTSNYPTNPRIQSDENTMIHNTNSSTTGGGRHKTNGNTSDSSAYDTTQEYNTDNNNSLPRNARSNNTNSVAYNNNISGNTPNRKENEMPTSATKRGGVSNEPLVSSNNTNNSNGVYISTDDLQQFITIRDQYQTLANQFTQVLANRDELDLAVKNREKEIERYRKEKQEYLESMKDGVRQRTTTPATTPKTNIDDDNDILNSTENNPPGFALWQVLLLAFIMFLLGRLTVDIL